MEVKNMTLRLAYRILKGNRDLSRKGIPKVKWVLFRGGSVIAGGFIDNQFLWKYGQSPVVQVNITEKVIVMSDLVKEDFFDSNNKHPLLLLSK